MTETTEVSVTGVDTTGSIVAIPIHRALRQYPVDRLDIVQDAGSATQVDWHLNETSNLNEIDQVAEDDGAALPIHVQAQGGGWSYNGLNLENGDLHLELVPDDDTTANDFTVRIHINKGE